MNERLAKRYFLLIGPAAAVLSACVASQANPSSATVVPLRVSAIAAPPSPAPSIRNPTTTVAGTPTALPWPDSLPRDTIVFASLDNPNALGEEPKYSLNGVDRQGQIIAGPLRGPGPDARFSLDGASLAFTELISPGQGIGRLIAYDFVSHSAIEVLRETSLPNFSWSPNRMELLADAVTPARTSQDIYLITLSTGQVLKLTDCMGASPQGKNCYNPLWSPDGKWIAYNVAAGDQFGSPISGTYLMDVRCIEAPSRCLEMSRGPIKAGQPQAWSPDSRVLAYASATSVFLVDVRTSSVKELTAKELTAPSDREIEGLAWSPDGKEIALARNGSVYVASIESGVFSQVLHWPTFVVVVAWLPRR
jgi:hypothetical protein